MVSYSFMWFVSQASLRDSKMPTIEISSLEMKLCAFSCRLTFFTNIVKYLDTVPSKTR